MCSLSTTVSRAHGPPRPIIFQDEYSVRNDLLDPKVLRPASTTRSMHGASRRSTGTPFVVKRFLKEFTDEGEVKAKGNSEIYWELAAIKRRGGGRFLPEVREPEQCPKYTYFVVGYIAGPDLCSLIHADGYLYLGLQSLQDLLVELCKALQELHQLGFVHRDLKLENVVIDDSAYPRVVLKLIDFDNVVPVSQLTSSTVYGTDNYIPPECYMGDISPAADMWALGVCAFRLFTGRHPFKIALFDDGPGENVVGHPAMKGIHDRLVREVPKVRKRLQRALQEESSLGKEDRAVVEDFIMSLIHVSPKERLTATKALAHPLLRGDAVEASLASKASLSAPLREELSTASGTPEIGPQIR